MQTANLIIEISSYWHPGSGRGSGSHLDALTDRDTDGLPYLPGRMVKGLLRDAMHRAESWGHVTKGMTEALFGSIGFVAAADERPAQSRDRTRSGELRIGNARLPDDVRAWLSAPEQSQARVLLAAELFQTALSADSGTAINRSLRGMEVLVPMTLVSTLRWNGSTARDWPSAIKTALPLIRAVGAHRTRGLGRASITLEVSHA